MPGMQLTPLLPVKAAFQLRFGLGVEQISRGAEARQLLCWIEA